MKKYILIGLLFCGCGIEAPNSMFSATTNAQRITQESIDLAKQAIEQRDEWRKYACTNLMDHEEIKFYKNMFDHREGTNNYHSGDGQEYLIIRIK